MYQVNQKVCLWQTNIVPGSNQITVVKEVIVTITEIKTGVPGEYSGKPVSHQSLRGVGDDGKTYEKHWDQWPESQTNDFLSSWTHRDDGVSINGNNSWTPYEAVHGYNIVSRVSKKRVKLIDLTGVEIKPKGDVVYCEKHDCYNHAGVDCIYCRCKLTAVS